MNRYIVQRGFWPVPLVLWTAVVLASLAWNWSAMDRRVQELAASQGRFTFRMIESVRLWNARHGGVYVFVTGDTPPNPYLEGVPDRDLRTADGRLLTLVNPAYMTSQLGGSLLSETRTTVRQVSLNPLNPGNRADAWEAAALREFKGGAVERMQIVNDGGRPMVRYIGALTTRQDCLQCHEKQGYRIGEVGGGISLTFPADPIVTALTPEKRRIAAIHAGVWLGVALLSLAGLQRLRAQMLSLRAAKEQQDLLVEQRTAQLAQEVRERKQAETRLRQLIDASGEGIFGVDADGICVFCSPAAVRMMGCRDSSELLGQPILRLLSNHNRELEEKLAVFRSGVSARVDSESFWRADGSSFPVEYRLAPIFAEDKVTGAVLTFQDITERRRSQAQIWLRANYDQLTGLPNRSLFHDRLEQAMLQENRAGRSLALLFIDLDGFKEVNDRHGHSAGDQLLKEVGRRLRAAVRESDTVARLGGDEFTIILPDARERAGVETAARKILDAVAAPYRLAGRRMTISCSIGIALYPADGASLTALVRNADAAMYRAKKAGKNTCRFYSEATP